MPYKLGKTPARPDSIKLKFSAYATRAKLPPHPKDAFGHFGLVSAKGWGELGNSDWGDCVWAGAAHETMMWNYEAKRQVSFTTKSVLSDYSAVTGFNPSDPNSDAGTDMEVAAKYRRTTGVLDGHGKRHQIAAYLAIEKGNLEQHLEATWLFGAVGLGIQCPAYMMDQFSQGKPWDVDPNGDGSIQGGHYIPIVGYQHGMLLVVTWGQIQRVTPAFFEKFNDESVCYISEETMTDGKSPEGFDLAALQTDLKQITSA